MKIILVQPYYKKSFSIGPPLGLGYLASVLRNSGHEVSIVDCIAKDITADRFQELVRVEQPEIIGITILSLFLEEAKKLISKIKEIYAPFIIIGGPHVTALPIDSLSETGADFAVIGEGEETVKELLTEIGGNQKFDQVRGIGYKSKEGKILINQPRPLINNLNAIAFPDWELFDLDAYPPIPHGIFYKRYPIANIITTRGCPMDCTFCAVKLTFGRTLRMRSAKNVVDEIELLFHKFGVKEFCFEDDNFTASRGHALNIAQEIITRKIDITWSCPSGIRIDMLDEDLLRKMRESGCYRISVGIESSSQRILDRVRKDLDIKLIPKAIKMIKNLGLQVEGFFIFGLPGETKQTIRDSIKFALHLPFDIIRFHNLAILPGTEIYRDWFKEVNERIDWQKTTVIGEAVLENKDLSAKELVKFQKKANRVFYLRPNNLIRVLFMIKPRQFIWLIKRAIRLFI
jgi:anaerobic magnesium-protoporphyrin IX monomethyl ester cyclase